MASVLFHGLGGIILAFLFGSSWGLADLAFKKNSKLIIKILSLMFAIMCGAAFVCFHVYLIKLVS